MLNGSYHGAPVRQDLTFFSNPPTLVKGANLAYEPFELFRIMFFPRLWVQLDREMAEERQRMDLSLYRM